jgi:hypothetical protein
MDNVYVGCSFFMNKGFVSDGAFSRKKFEAFRTKYSNFGYVEDSIDSTIVTTRVYNAFYFDLNSYSG